FREWDCEIGECQLLPGDTLALYTDGITESRNSADDEFGEERLVEALRTHRGGSPQALIDAMVDQVRRFSPHEQQDDVTLIIAKHTAVQQSGNIKLLFKIVLATARVWL